MSTEINGNTWRTIVCHLAQAEVGEPVSLVIDSTRYVCTIEDDDTTGMDHINGHECYGKVAWPVRNDYTREGRPEGFTGAAMKLRTMYGDAYWWEPYREGHKVYNDAANRQPVEDLMNGYGPYGVTVKVYDLATCQCCDHTETTERDRASLWGIDAFTDGYKAEVIEELLHRCGVTTPATDRIGR